MENEKNKDNVTEQVPVNIASELKSIRENLRKRESDTTTLKILFYTGLAVLLFGFFYTNQTLQRAQHRNLESKVKIIQSQVSHTLLMLEKKLHEEILDLDKKLSSTPDSSIGKRIQNMNHALDKLEPLSTKISTLIEKVQKSSNELRNIMEAENLQKTPPTKEILVLE
jgi:hypothetical protein